jgi:cell division protein FtsN
VIELAAASTSTSAWDEPGTLGFLVVFGMGVVLYFVFRSMAKHLRKVRQAASLESEQGQPGRPGESIRAGQPSQQTPFASGSEPDSSRDSEYERQQREANAIDVDFF